MKKQLLFGILLLSLIGCSLFQVAPPTRKFRQAYSPSPTRTVSETLLPSQSPIPSSTWTRTAIPTLFPPALAGTPLAMPGTVIDAGNVDRVAELARWNTGDMVAINKLVFVLGGKIVASMEDCRIVERDVASGQVVRTISTPSQCFGDIAASPDGEILASSGWDPRSDDDSIIRLWDAGSGQLLRSFGGMAFHVAFSPDGKTVAGTDYYGIRITFWDAITGKQIRDIGGGGWGTAFLPDGKNVATAWGSLITVWDTSTVAEIRSFTGDGRSIWNLVSSRDGKLLASGSSDGLIQIWDFETGKILHTIDGQWDDWSELAFLPDGTALASCGKDHTVRIWSTATGQRLRTLSGNTGAVMSIAFSPDGSLLASGSADQSTKVWNTETGEVLRTLSGDGGGVLAVAVSPDGKTLASGFQDGSIKLWDLTTGGELPAPAGHAGEVVKLTFSPDGTLLASTSGAGKIKLWETATGEELFTIRENNDGVGDIIFSPDGKKLAVAAAEHLEVWDMVSGEELSRRDWQRDMDFAVLTFSPDGKTLAAGSTDGRISLWDYFTGLKLSTIKAGSNWGQEIVYSPDGSHLAFSWGYWPGSFCIVDPVSGRTILASDGGSLAFSPNGKIFASNPESEIIRLWDLETGRELRTLYGHEEIVDGLAFSPDGRLLASISRDGTIRIWGVAP